jgi:hypothetical protein
MKRKWMSCVFGIFLVAFGLAVIAGPASAHHVLGRPAYALNEDSNTPPALQGESEIGEYYVTYMIYPAFPKPNEPGRINLHIKHRDTGKSYRGRVTFLTRDDTLLSLIGIGDDFEKLGAQPNDDNVYRQRYICHENGDYIVSARFDAGGQPYAIDLPLRVGPPSAFGPIGFVVGLLIFIMLAVNVIQRRRVLNGKIRQAIELGH